MGAFVAYYRVSTDRQGQSGLGLEAQREAVARHVAAAPILTEFTEVESGKSHRNRPQLTAALDLCRRRRATLVIAKLDRLARNVHFITGLMESRVDFVCCDNPHANKAMLQLLAVFAEHEREQISQRTKAALSQAKRELAEKGHRVSIRGNVYTKLGNPRWKDTLHCARAARHPQTLPQQVIDLIRQQRDRGSSLRAIAAYLEAMQITAPGGPRWHPQTITEILTRSQQANA